MKFILLKLLPPIFRIVERLGLALPRKFFKRATYVPTDLLLMVILILVKGVRQGPYWYQN